MIIFLFFLNFLKLSSIDSTTPFSEPKSENFLSQVSDFFVTITDKALFLTSKKFLLELMIERRSTDDTNSY